ncbi:MAG: type II toxin-antitoxin system RelE/ParE family toxin [Magnetococcales bacterium]|nr:type II toxin-antitoxin system RelE/ParE family toxin [Magnetococcales bacterium]
MVYKIIIPSKVEKQISNLPKPEWQRIRNVIDSLETNPKPPGALKMKGQIDRWRIRSGNYRLLYTIEDDQLVVLILKAGHRREVYR